MIGWQFIAGSPLKASLFTTSNHSTPCHQPLAARQDVWQLAMPQQAAHIGGMPDQPAINGRGPWYIEGNLNGGTIILIYYIIHYFTCNYFAPPAGLTVDPHSCLQFTIK